MLIRTFPIEDNGCIGDPVILVCLSQAWHTKRLEMNEMPESLKSNNTLLMWNLLGAAVVFGTMDGMIGVAARTPVLLDISEAFIFNFILFYWFMVDSGIRKYHPSWFLKFMVVVLGLIALAWYIIRSRGLKPSIRSLVCALGLLMLAVAVATIVTMLVSGLTGHGFFPPE